MPVLDPKERYIHRDLSWLKFNGRVLEEASDESNPLIERLRFLAIFSNNFDEFLMVRVAGLLRLIDSGYSAKDPFGYYPQDLYIDIKEQINVLMSQAYTLHDTKIKKELAKNKIFFKNFEELNNEQKRHAKKFFDSTLYSIITPMAVDQGHPFPVLPSKTMAFAVILKRQDKTHLAILPIPQIVPRVLKLPSETGEHDFILIEEINSQNLKNFFKGYTVENFTLFRVIRDSEISISEELSPDLLKAIETEIRKRSKAKVVHLAVHKSCADDLLPVLCEGLSFPKAEVVLLPGELDLTYIFGMISQIDRPDLCYKPFMPRKVQIDNIFEKMKEGDFILHFPYQSFLPTVELIQAAAKDENVLAIKMTLYRTNEDSAIIKALKEAAKNRKQVTVLVEIKARFDEERNINWVKELEDSGCHVNYGMPGLKIHSKMALIVRKEENRIQRYVHLSTGNYNERTSRIYTDISYFTANDDFARDISDIFNVITGYSVPAPWKRIIASPTDLRKYFFDLIDREIECQKKYKNGYIFAKMNALEDTAMIEKLYQASSEGVKIRLLVRGICSLVPGVPDLSENIEVHSIVGRFLEHSRMYIFNNNGTPRVFLSSADWMRRNFDSRVEILFEIYKEEIKDHLQKITELYWKDTQKTRVLMPDKDHKHIKTPSGFSVQEYFISFYAA